MMKDALLQLAEKLGKVRMFHFAHRFFFKQGAFIFFLNFECSFHNKNHKMPTNTTTVRQQNQLGILNASDDKLLKKLQSKFTDEEQQLFVKSFRMYLNHDQETEYIVDLDDIWEWLGFSRKDNCKRLLEKFFKQGIDYKITLLASEGQLHGGHNKETILMNIKTFKKMCLKAGTKKADDVHNYYIKMEETLHEYLLENAKRQAKLEREKALIESFDKKPVNYLGSLQVDGEDFWKFGVSDDLYNRIKKLKKELGESFVVEVVVECERNFLLETKFKAHHEIVTRRTQKVINGKLQTELLKLDDKCNDKDENLFINKRRNSNRSRQAKTS